MPVEHYIDIITYVLKTGISWKDIEYMNLPLHYQTYYKKFQQWSIENVFKNAFHCQQKILEAGGYFTETRKKELLIDCTMIRNIKGIETIGRNHYDRYRYGSKVSIIMNKEGFILGMKMGSANTHDQKLVTDNIEDIQIKIIGSKLIGDKGYNSTPLKKKIKETKKVDLIYHMKRNQKEQNTQEELELLKERIKIEHRFQNFKTNKRLANRYDKNFQSFQSFWYLAMTCLNSSLINKQEY